MTAQSDTPAKVFVSYATADLATVDMVKKWSTDPQVEVFVAEHSAPAGTALNDRIIAEIQGCDLFLLMWSAEASKSEYVLQEVGVAVGANRPILPVVLEQGFPLPALIVNLKYLDAPRYPSEWLVAVQKRLDEMAQTKQSAAVQAQAKAAQPVQLKLTGVEVVLVAAVIVLVILLLTTKGGPGAGAV
jgi:TIR domain-containing protein